MKPLDHFWEEEGEPETALSIFSQSLGRQGIHVLDVALCDSTGPVTERGEPLPAHAWPPRLGDRRALAVLLPAGLDKPVQPDFTMVHLRQLRAVGATPDAGRTTSCQVTYPVFVQKGAETTVFQLPPADPATVTLAMNAYRLAVQYRVRLDEKWAPRGAELRTLDEFDPLRTEWETASYLSGLFIDEGAEILLSAVAGKRRITLGEIADETNSTDPAFLEVRLALDDAHIALRATKAP